MVSRLERVVERQHVAGGGGIEGLIPLQATEVLLIEGVLDVQVGANAVGHADTGHQIDHRIGILNEGTVAVGRDFALPAPGRAELEVAKLRNAVGGRQLEGLARQVGARVVIVAVLDRQVGPAAINGPVRRDLAGDFQFVTFDEGVDTGVIAVKRTGEITGPGRQTILLGFEYRSRGIKTIVKPLGLDTGFIAFALGGCERCAVEIDFRLRIENICIAGIQRYIGVDVIDGPDIRADLVLRTRLRNTV